MKRLCSIAALIVFLLAVTGANVSAENRPAINNSTDSNLGFGLQGDRINASSDPTTTSPPSDVQSNQPTPATGVFSKQNIMAEVDPKSPKPSRHQPTIVLSGLVAVVIIAVSAYLIYKKYLRNHKSKV